MQGFVSKMYPLENSPLLRDKGKTGVIETGGGGNTSFESHSVTTTLDEPKKPTTKKGEQTPTKTCLAKNATTRRSNESPSVHCDSYLLIIYFINPINSFHITYVYYNLPRKKEILTSFLVFSPYIFTHAPLNYKEKNLIKICRANFRRKKEGVFAFNTGHYKLFVCHPSRRDPPRPRLSSSS